MGETRKAVVIERPPPNYPRDAFRAQTEGWVDVTFIVTAEGKVKDGAVVNASPARVFNTAALEAISKWKFKPRLENDRPVEERISTRIEFVMSR